MNYPGARFSPGFWHAGHSDVWDFGAQGPEGARALKGAVGFGNHHIFH